MFRIMHWLTSGLAILKLAKTRRKGEIEMPMDTKTDFCGHFKTGDTKFEKVLLRDPILSVFSPGHDTFCLYHVQFYRFMEEVSFKVVFHHIS